MDNLRANRMLPEAPAPREAWAQESKADVDCTVRSHLKTEDVNDREAATQERPADSEGTGQEWLACCCSQPPPYMIRSLIV